MSKRHLALYGNVKLVRDWCPDCARYALVSDGLLQCCDAPAADDSLRAKRMSEPPQERHGPTGNGRKQILAEQDNRCIYCGQAFGSLVLRAGNVRPTRLVVRWDHLVPHAYGQDNADTNFAAACQVCNGIKHDKVFRTIEEAQVYIRARLDEKGYG